MIANLIYATSYALLGAALLVVGYYLLDLLTPGHLASQLAVEKSLNAGIVLSAGFLAQGVVVFSAIWFNGESGFGPAFGYTAAYGLLGIALQAIMFGLLDLIMPGGLRHRVVETTFHPAALVLAAAQVAVSLAVVASIA